MNHLPEETRYHLNLYHGLGFKTIPINPKQKGPPPTGHINLSSDEMWKRADPNSNIALAAGDNGMFLLDPDTPEGMVMVDTHFTNLGVQPFKMHTWSGCSHSWVKTKVPESLKYAGKLIDHAGDWKASHGYGLGAPSYIQGTKRDGSYSEGFYTLPTSSNYSVPFVEFTDIMSLLNITEANPSTKTNISTNKDYSYSDLCLPIPVLRRKTNKWIYRLADRLLYARKGQPIMLGDRKWSSRSEAAQSVITHLLLDGLSTNEIRQVLTIPGKETDQWYKQSFQSAINFIVNTGDRPWLAEEYYRSISGPYKSKDIRVYKAALAIAWQAGNREVYISRRDLELGTGYSSKAILSSRDRICQHGWMKRIDNDENTSKFYIRGFPDTISLPIDVQDILTSTPNNTTPQNMLFGVDVRKKRDYSVELFRHGALTANMETLPSFLSDSPISCKELVVMIGASESTVYRSMAELVRLGVARKMKGGWVLGHITFVDIQDQFDTDQAGQVRRNRIEKERTIYKQKQVDYMVDKS